MLLLIDLLDPGEYGRSVTLLCVVTMKSDSNLTPELSRAAKRRRLGRIVRAQARDLNHMKNAMTLKNKAI